MNAPVTQRRKFAVPGWVHVSDAHVGIWEQGDEARTFESTHWLYVQMLDFLRARGWSIRQEARVDRLIRRHYHIGRKGDLRAAMNTGGRAIQVEFWQEVTPADNPNGARYDFRRMERMPPRLRIACTAEMAALVGWAERLRGYTVGPEWRWADPPKRSPLATVRAELRGVRPEDGALDYFNSRWGDNGLPRGPDGWPLSKDCTGYGVPLMDRDKRIITPGDVKYHRHHTGALWRGRVYPNMNGMCFMVSGAGNAFAGSWEFFDLADGESGRRKSPRRVGRLKGELEKAVKASNFERAIVLRDLLKKEHDATARAEVPRG